jgi:hypothetical protein
MHMEQWVLESGGESSQSGRIFFPIRSAVINELPVGAKGLETGVVWRIEAGQVVDED